MAYNKFTLDLIRKAFKLKIVAEPSIFKNIHPIPPSDILQKYLECYLPLGNAIGTEKAKSEFIIAPILAELIGISQHQATLFSGIEFNVDEAQGLTGRCDFIFSASNIQYILTAPVLIIIEAKHDNINKGLGQCAAAMMAARIFNEKEANPHNTTYGVVTTGNIWKFLKLDQDTLYIDNKEYFIAALENILGILSQIIEEAINIA
jgi:hypothetical protein